MKGKFVFFNVFFLVSAVLVLVSVGIIMLTSTGAYAHEAKGDPQFFLKRQLAALVVGVVVCVALALTDYRWMEKWWWVFYGAAAVMLVLCFVPGIGKRINGSSRWIGMGGQVFQPSELAKLAVLVALAWWYARRDTVAKSLMNGFIIPLGIVCGLVGMIVPEVDLGTSALLIGTALLVMFVAGTRSIYLAGLACGAVGLLVMAIQHMPERLGRVISFMRPQDFPEDAYQQLQGLIGLGNGGIWGLGIGLGMQKLSFLPYAHTDFILPNIGEELGVFATLGIVLLYLVVLLSGTVIAMRASDKFGRLLGFGIVALLALQAAMNVGVTTMVLPNKGLPLPFISFGGSNLVFCLTSIGILISIYRRGYGERPDPEGRIFDAKLKKKKQKISRI